PHKMGWIMDCEFVGQEELAEQFVSGTLDPARQTEFEVHLLECSQCANLVEMLEDVRADLVGRHQAVRDVPAQTKWHFKWSGRASRSARRVLAWTVISLSLIPLILSLAALIYWPSWHHQKVATVKIQPPATPTPPLTSQQVNATVNTTPRARSPL